MTQPHYIDREAALSQLQIITANTFKQSLGDTYAAANRQPVGILKGRTVTHVLMSLAAYQALAVIPTQGGSRD